MHARKDNAKTQFDSWSRWYDGSLLQPIFFRPTQNAIVALLNEVSTKATILDVGCGTGKLAEQLLESSFASVVGVDLSPGMVGQSQLRCERFGKRGTFIIGDSEHLPIASHSVDVVTCAHSFHHYPNQLAVMREFARVLKPHGTLLLADANRDQVWGWALYDGFVNWLEGGVTHCSAARFRELLDAAGFDVVSQTHGGWIMPWMINRAVLREVAVQTPRRAA